MGAPKFNLVWNPKYIAVTGGLDSLIDIVDIAALISGSLTGIVRK